MIPMVIAQAPSSCWHVLLRDLGLWLISVYKDVLEQAQGWTKSYE